MVAIAVVPAYYTQSTTLAFSLICFGLFAIQVKGAAFFTLPTDLFPANRVATVWGVFGAVGSLGGSLLGLLAGYLIQGTGYESVFLLIASLHLISALLLQILVPKIELVTR
jgi:ACS family hexuronate transporter-like MFS transporter